MKRVNKAIYIIITAVIALMLCGFAPDGSTPQSYAELEISIDGKIYDYSDGPVAPSDFSVAEQIEKRRINSPLSEKIECVDGCLAHGASYRDALERCFPLLVRKVDGIADGLYTPPINAEVAYDGGRYGVKKEKAGRELDTQKLYAAIYCALKFSGGGRVTAHTVPIKPDITAEELKQNLVLRGKYTTDYTTSSAARAHNVTKALQKFDGLCLKAGETLSFNGIVGERTESAGFKSAKIIVDGKYTDGIGGGVCQASTAVYNAALVAGLNCEANAHSICPSYCPAGLDAMISSVSDLLITNVTTHPVYFSVKTGGGKGAVTIYGERPEHTVVPESVVVETVRFETEEFTDVDGKYFDETAERGDRLLVSPGKDGVKSETYLNLYSLNGELVKRVKVRENSYKVVTQRIAVAP